MVRRAAAAVVLVPLLEFPADRLSPASHLLSQTTATRTVDAVVAAPVVAILASLLPAMVPPVQRINEVVAVTVSAKAVIAAGAPVVAARLVPLSEHELLHHLSNVPPPAL